MPHFTSSTKTLLSFSETTATKKLVAKYGDRLTGLNRGEKYKLVAAISIYLGLSHVPGESDMDAKRFATENLLTIAEYVFHQSLPNDVDCCLDILKDESIDSLASILSPISEYAREDNS